MEEVNKNHSDFRKCPNINSQHLNTDCYKHSLVYMNHMANTNQKFMRDIQKNKEKEIPTQRYRRSLTYKRRKQENNKGTEKNSKNN